MHGAELSPEDFAKKYIRERAWAAALPQQIGSDLRPKGRRISADPRIYDPPQTSGDGVVEEQVVAQRRIARQTLRQLNALEDRWRHAGSLDTQAWTDSVARQKSEGLSTRSPRSCLVGGFWLPPNCPPKLVRFGGQPCALVRLDRIHNRRRHGRGPGLNPGPHGPEPSGADGGRAHFSPDRSSGS